MGLPRFEYLAPKTIDEACEMLEKYGEKAKIKAGGTDLLIKMSNRVITPEYVIGLKNIEGLDYIEFDEKEGLRIGALALLSDIADNPVVKEKYPAVAYAASVTATNQVRNMATLVGNLCNAAPSADNAPTLLALGAEIVLHSLQGDRVIPLEEFFKGPGLTALKPNEIVKEVRVPVPEKNSGMAFLKASQRGKVDIAAVNIGVYVTVNENKFENVNIFLGAVAPIPVRAKNAENECKGKEISDEILYKAGEKAKSDASPITDMRASREYRLILVEVLTRRALRKAVENII